MRRLTRSPVFAAFVALLLGAAFAADSSATGTGLPRIAVVAIVDHPDIDAMRRGIGDSLRAADLSPGSAVELDYLTAQADPARVETLADGLADGDADLVIALSAPMARAIAARPLRVPVILCGLPIDAADTIVADRQARLLTGVAFGTVVSAQFELIETIRPDVRTVLVPWRASAGGEPPLLRTLAGAARTRSFSIVGWPLPAEGVDLPALPAGGDASKTLIYLAAELVGHEATGPIAAAALHAMPTVSDSRDLVVRGATAAIVHDYYAVGRQAGDLAAAIMQDPTRARQPVMQADASYLVVNGEAASDPRLRLAVPLDALAHEVIAWAEPEGPHPLAKPKPPEALPSALP